MSNQLNIKKNVIMTVIAFLVNILLTFVGYRLLIEKGGLEILGLWSMISATIFIMRIGDIGMGGAAERYMATVNIHDNAKLIREYFDTALIVNTLIFSFLALIGWLIFSKNIEWIISKNIILQAEALKLLPIMFLVFLISNISNVFSGGLRGLHLGYLGAYISIMSGIFQMILIIFLVPKIGVLGLAWAQLVQYSIIIIITWLVIYKNMKTYEKFNILPIYASRKILKKLFSFSIRAQFVTLINGLFEPVSKFLVGHTAGLSTLGIYELAYKIVSLPRNAVVSGVLSMMPAITRLLTDDRNQAIKLYYKSKKLVILATLSVFICIIISSPIISLLLLKSINWYLITFIILFCFGFIGNVLGAPAYILGFSSGQLAGNLISSFVVLLFLTIGTMIFNYFIPYSAVMFSVISLFLGGLIIKSLNEKILNNTKI